MSAVIFQEAEKVFGYILAIEMEESWGQYLSANQQFEVMSTLAPIITGCLESEEKSWCIENQDKLSIVLRSFIEPVLRESFKPDGSFVMADKIADTSAEVLNKIKLIIDAKFDKGSDDDSDNGPDCFTVGSEDENGNVLYDTEGGESDAFNAGRDEIASNGISEMSGRLHSPGADSMTLESEEEMMSGVDDEIVQSEFQKGDGIFKEDVDMDSRSVFSSPARSDQGGEEMSGVDSSPVDVEMADSTLARDHVGNGILISSPSRIGEGDEKHDEGEEGEPTQGRAAKKSRVRQKEPKSAFDHNNNPLYSVVMDAKNPKWPPRHYKCKVGSCGSQGVWAARWRHFAAKHPREWEEATGSPAKVFRCEVDGCGWSTAQRCYMAQHLEVKHNIGTRGA